MAEFDTWDVRDLLSVAERLAVPGAGNLDREALVNALVAMGFDPTRGPSAEPRVGSLLSGAGRRVPDRPTPPVIRIPDLPWAYQDDRLVLLARDPRTLFTYWDCNPDTVRAAQAQVPDGVAVIRLLSLAAREPQLVREIGVELENRGFYLYDLEPNREYRVELAFRSPTGEERLILRPSNVVTLPPNQPSAWIEDRLASIPLEIPLPGAALFLAGRTLSDKERRLHARAYQLSLGQAAVTGDVASSAQGILEGFGGRSWSGTVVRK
jgi:hypothetical protein